MSYWIGGTSRSTRGSRSRCNSSWSRSRWAISPCCRCCGRWLQCWRGRASPGSRNRPGTRPRASSSSGTSARETVRKGAVTMLHAVGVVDADAHVDETDATWEYMTAAESRFKPITYDPPEGRSLTPGDVRPHRFWLVDGRLGMRRWRSDERTGT